MNVKQMRLNVLGDIRAEADDEMLHQAFIETPDYLALIESWDRTIVVGRRGTGKSALVKRLERHWKAQEEVKIINIAPEEHQTISLRPLASLFGEKFRHIRAGMRIAWRHALMVEVAQCLMPMHRFSKLDKNGFLRSRVQSWLRRGHNVIDRYGSLLEESVDKEMTEDKRIGDLAKKLDLDGIEKALKEMPAKTGTEIVILIDCLDEGYSPDEIGVGIIDGLIHGASEVKTRIPGVKPIIFLRDNIFRSIKRMDPDYSRNIEGSVLRLHWDEQALYEFATRRMKVAFDIKQESTVKIWNSCTHSDLHGKKGFLTVLRMTLHRPRDILLLLNGTFERARKRDSRQISQHDLKDEGLAISQSRLDDLIKEYEEIFPAIQKLLNLFQNRPAEWNIKEFEQKVSEISRESEDSIVRQELSLANEPITPYAHVLFSIGFLGLEVAPNTFKFCHDGRRKDEISESNKALVHPCYWMALGCSVSERTELSEIYDEYGIETAPASSSVRNKMIDDVISEFSQIPIGQEGAIRFEKWCEKAIRICFAKGLRNVERRPNRQARLQRDIVATNVAETNSWKRIYDDYECRQVVFEVKNKEDLSSDDFHQITSYLNKNYGRIGFIITRQDSNDLHKGKDLDWVRDIYHEQNKLVVKLTGKYFCSLLRKLKNPQKHDSVNDAIHKVLDTYTRLYIEGQTKKSVKRKKKKRRRK